MFCSRADRETTVSAPGCTTDKIGPGSYNSVLPAGRRVVPSLAPFASNSQRLAAPAQHGSAAATAAASPPSSASSSHSVYTKHSSSSFCSGTERFTLNKEDVSKPGPGSYVTPSKWRRPRHPAAAAAGPRLLTQTATASLLQHAAVLQQASLGGAVPVLTPPSIPARHQSYGYEQSPTGVLLMQQQPPATADVGPTADSSSSAAGGVRSVQAGGAPGRPGGSSGGGSGKGTRWAASTVQRWAPPPPSEERPGRLGQRQQQQQQQTQQLDTSTKFRVSTAGSQQRLLPCRTTCPGSFSTAGSAAFASQSALAYQLEADPERRTPGPGAYRSHHRPGSAPAAAAGQRLSTQQQAQRQLFGRTAGRDSCQGGLSWGATSAAAAAPGPGSYELAASGALGRVISSSRAGWPGAARGPGMDQGGASCGGFGSTCTRFDDASSAAPGPGKYASDQVVSLSNDVARRAAASACSRGAFGSAADRSPLSSAAAGAAAAAVATVVGAAAGGGTAAAVPGPGRYEVDAGVAQRVAAASAHKSATFVSASKRFTPSTAPPAAPDFACWDGQAGTLRGDAASRGPGAYRTQDDWGSKCSAGRLSYHRAPFGSEAKRQSPAAAGAGSATPGPGDYSGAAVDMRQVFRPLTVPAAGFHTGSKRFGSFSSPAPGPGTYADQLGSSLVRPSFNVTAGR